MNTERLPLDTRKSPLDSVTFRVDGEPVKVCYSRPSARGRTMLGDRLAYGELWRTGANEPTMIHTSTDLEIAGLQVPAGTYALYTVPGATEWEIIVNRSTDQWGHERYYSEDVRAQELGRATVPAERVEEHTETFTIRAVPEDGEATLVLEWEHIRVAVPVSSADGPTD